MDVRVSQKTRDEFVRKTSRRVVKNDGWMEESSKNEGRTKWSEKRTTIRSENTEIPVVKMDRRTSQSEERTSQFEERRDKSVRVQTS